MIPKGCHVVDNFNVPDFFVDKIAVVTDGIITDIESTMFYLAMGLVGMKAEASPPPIPLLGLNVYFLENESITFSLDEDVFGCFHQAIIFPVWNWRERGLTSETMLVIMVEELCHAVWLIPDGPLIEEKVREIFEQQPDQFSPDFVTDMYKKIDQMT